MYPSYVLVGYGPIKRKPSEIPSTGGGCAGWASFCGECVSAWRMRSGSGDACSAWVAFVGAPLRCCFASSTDQHSFFSSSQSSVGVCVVLHGVLRVVECHDRVRVWVCLLRMLHECVLLLCQWRDRGVPFGFQSFVSLPIGVFLACF